MSQIDPKTSSLHIESSKALDTDQVLFEGLSNEETRCIEKRCTFHFIVGSLRNTSFNSGLVVRKIDFHLISALFLLFIFNILDRSNIANARLGGLQEDLKLSDSQYQTGVAIMVSKFTFERRKQGDIDLDKHF
jgi:hypothetical protein